MALESGTYIKDLVETNPTGVDQISQGDNHLRLIKSVLKNSFPSNTNAPVIPDMAGNANKYLQVKSDETAAIWSELDIAALTRITGQLHRAKFEKSGSTAIKIYPGVYDLDSKGKVVKWNSVLTKSFTVTNGFNYVYLDSSAINPDIDLTATEILVSSAVPTYDGAKRGWYNGDDRCIFVFYGASGVVWNFHHNNEYVFYTDQIANNTSITTNGWTAHTVTVPPLTAHGELTVKTNAKGGYPLSSEFLMRHDSGNGQNVGRAEAGSGGLDDGHTIAKVRQLTYASGGASYVQIYKSGGDSTNRAELYTNGFYLPDGM
jgi:hypothetical protein